MRLQVLSADLVPTLKSKSFPCVYGGLQAQNNLQGWGCWQAMKTVCFTLLKNLPLISFTVCYVF